MNVRALLGLCLLVPALSACTPQNTRNAEEAAPAAVINTQLGNAYIRDHDYDRAMKKLQRALREDPSYPLAHASLGVLYEQLGEMGKADDHFRTALKLDPKNSSIRNNYGGFLCRNGRLKEADTQFQLAVSNPLYANAEYAYTNAGLCALRTHDKAKAEKYFRQALIKQPRFAPALFQMAQLSYDAKHYLSARAYLQRYGEVEKENPSFLWLGIQVETRLGNKDAAGSYALRLKAKFPDSHEAQELAEMERHGS